MVTFALTTDIVGDGRVFLFRLLEAAPEYYNVANIPDCAARRVMERLANQNREK